MLIDNFTIIAQAINFMILVYLLHRFLYGPVIRIMDEREKKISQTMEQAKRAEEAAAKTAHELAKEKQVFIDTREQLLADAHKDIENWRETQVEAVKSEIEGLRGALKNSLEKEQQAFLGRLKEEVTRQVLRISEKAIKDLAAQRLENRIIFVFLEKVKALEKQLEMKNFTGDVRVTSGFELDPEMTLELSRKFSEWFPKSKSIGFNRSEALGMGIEVTAGDRKTAWNLDKYLTGLEEEIRFHLKTDIRKAA